MMDTQLLYTCQKYAEARAREWVGAGEEQGQARLIQSMPEMFFGRSRLLLCNPKSNLVLSFSPFEALSQCVVPIQEKCEMKEGAAEKERVDHVDFMPAPIAVVGAEKWKDKDTSKIKDYKAIETKMDWSYCTPYKGWIHRYADAEALLKEVGLEFG